MPELPEVEYAASVARRVAEGKRIGSVEVLHAAQRRGLPPRASRSLAGDGIARIERRGKYQVFRLTSGRSLLVHFRMTGDWAAVQPGGELPAHTRILFRLEDGAALALVDSRALGGITLYPPDIDPLPDLGPEANSADFNDATLADALRTRRVPIKVALLDQGVVAGVGNIYASEALWYARVDPRRPANALGPAELRAVVTGVKRALGKALEHPERYYGADGVSDAVRFNVYDREGKGCRRCRSPIVRVTQGARSTYWCAECASHPKRATGSRSRGTTA